MVFSIRGGEWWVPTVGTGIIHLAQGCEYFALEAFSSFDRGIVVCYCLLPSFSASLLPSDRMGGEVTAPDFLGHGISCCVELARDKASLFWRDTGLRM